MEPFLIYLLKASGITILFLVIYLLILRRETFFKTNRVYLLVGLGMAVFLPFLIFTKTIWVEPMSMYQIQVPDQIMATTPMENPVDWTSLLLYGYCAGALFFAFRFVIQLFSLKKLIGDGKKIRDGKFIRVETDQKSSPFSFFNYLVYNPTLHAPGELDTIIIHEKIHAEGKHSLDIIVMHIFTVFQWCNPFIWWYRTCLDENLEYLADNKTIAQNATKTEYQYLLLRTGMGENRFSVATPFFNASIKKRIVMLNKNRSHRKNSFKYALILPLLAGFILLFNVKTEAQVKSMDSIPVDTNKYGQVTFDKERSGDFPSYGISSIDSNNTLIITKNIQPQVYIGDPVPLYLVNGKEITKSGFDKIDPNTIQAIKVWKEQEAIDKYGDKGKDGVVEIILKKEYGNFQKTSSSDDLKARSSSTLIIHDSVTGKPLVTGKASGVKLEGPDKGYLIILDGKEVSFNTLDAQDPENVESLNVWEGPKSIEKFGEKGKNGVIEMITKKHLGKGLEKGQKVERVWVVGHRMDTPNTAEKDSFGTPLQTTNNNPGVVRYGANGSNSEKTIGLEANPEPEEARKSLQQQIDTKALIILDGKEVTKSYFEKLDPETFKSISVLKGPKAIEKYGDKGKYGVIEAKTKSEIVQKGDSGTQDTWKVGVGLNESNPNWNVLKYYQQMEQIAPAKNSLPDIDKALIMIDGMPSSKKDLESITANRIKMLFPISAGDKDAIKKYGNKAKYGVVELLTKK